MWLDLVEIFENLKHTTTKAFKKNRHFISKLNGLKNLKDCQNLQNLQTQKLFFFKEQLLKILKRANCSYGPKITLKSKVVEIE